MCIFTIIKSIVTNTLSKSKRKVATFLRRCIASVDIVLSRRPCSRAQLRNEHGSTGTGRGRAVVAPPRRRVILRVTANTVDDNVDEACRCLTTALTSVLRRCSSNRCRNSLSKLARAWPCWSEVSTNKGMTLTYRAGGLFPTIKRERTLLLAEAERGEGT